MDSGGASLPVAGPRVDSCGSGCGTVSLSGMGYGAPGWNTIGLSRDQCDVLAVDGLMHRIVHLLIEDATKVDPDMSGPALGQLDEVWNYLEERHFTDQESRGLSYSRKYGGGALVIMADDGRDLSEPLDLLSVRTLRGFIDLEKTYCIPGPPAGRVSSSWWGPRWGQPSYYTVTSSVAAEAGSLQGGQKVHPSRVIPYRHRRDLNWRQAKQFTQWNGWGPGVIESIFQAFTARTNGIERTNGILRSFGYDHVQNDALHDELSRPGGKAAFKQWLDNIKACRDYTEDGVPIVVTGSEVKKWEAVSRNVSGLKDLIEAQRDFLLDYVEYPRVVLFGVTQGGLSDAASGEWQTYYQLVNAFQENQRWPGIRQAAIVAMAAKDGPTGGRVDYGLTCSWQGLEQEAEAERPDNRKKNAEAREKDAAVLGIDARTLALFDPTIEETYPGLQAAIDNGTVVLGASTPETAEGRPLPVSEAAAVEVKPSAAAPSESAGDDEGTADATTPEPQAFPSDLVTEVECRRALRCGPGTFKKWIREGKVSPFRVGNGRRYSLSEVMQAARSDRFDSAARMDPFPNEHAARQRNPKGMAGFRRKEIEPGVTLILGKVGGRGPMVTQSVRFAASEWSPSEAREWLAAHDYRTTLEEATGDGIRSDAAARLDAEAADMAAGPHYAPVRFDAASPGDLEELHGHPLSSAPVRLYASPVGGWKGWSTHGGAIAFWPTSGGVGLAWLTWSPTAGVSGEPMAIRRVA